VRALPKLKKLLATNGGNIGYLTEQQQIPLEKRIKELSILVPSIKSEELLLKFQAKGYDIDRKYLKARQYQSSVPSSSPDELIPILSKRKTKKIAISVYLRYSNFVRMAILLFKQVTTSKQKSTIPKHWLKHIQCALLIVTNKFKMKDKEFIFGNCTETSVQHTESQVPCWNLLDRQLH